MCVYSLQSFLHRTAGPPADRDHFTSCFLIWMLIISFSWLIALEENNFQLKLYTVFHALRQPLGHDAALGLALPPSFTPEVCGLHGLLPGEAITSKVILPPGLDVPKLPSLAVY